MLGLFLATVPFQSASALDPTKAISQYVHSTWGTVNGLPQNSVTRILETKDGYLWVGTQAGLARFDGVRFTIFDHTNTPALRDDFIADLMEDREGTLWIATLNNGVTSFHNGLFSHLDAIGLRAGSVLAADEDGSIWIGGFGGIKHVRNGVVIKQYTIADGLSGDPVRHILVDKARNVWIASDGGLNRLANGKIDAYSTRDGLPVIAVTGLYLEADNSLLVKTLGSDIVHWAHGHFEPWHLPIPTKAVRDMLRDRNGNLWIAGGLEGLLRVRGQDVKRFTTKEGLNSDQVFYLYEDRDGNLWVGTAGGLERFRDGSFTTYAKEEGLSADQTQSVMEDKLGDIWVTTPDGLDQLHGNHIRIYKPQDMRSDTWALLEDHASNLLIGTVANGLLRLDHGRLVQTLPEREGISYREISAMLEDSKDQLWLATNGGGLVRYTDGKRMVFTTSDGLLSNALYALAMGPDGTLWIGSDSGLNSIKNGQITNYPTLPSLSGAVVVALYFDGDNTLWIGSFGRGLFHLVNGHSTQYTTRQGLPSDSLSSIVEDAGRNLWVGSEKGVFRISRRDLGAVDAGTSKVVVPLLFDNADGMKSSELTGGTLPSVWRARDGRLWFPTNRGVVVVDPMRLLLNDRALPARVEEMVSDDLQVNLSTPVQLQPGTRRIEIRYTAPNLSSSERTQFRYRLDGFDEHWVPGGVQRVAQYTNLSPGHYTFHVSASADTGHWGTQESTLDFVVIPQFYQTWWFRLLGALAVIFMLLGIYRLRVNLLYARTAVLEERHRMAGEIHDSLAQGFSGIIFQTEAALLRMKRTHSTTVGYVESARDLARSSLQEARSSIWNLSPPAVDQKSLLESLSLTARQLTGGRVDELDIHSSGKAWIMQPEAQHHMVLIVQEALSNAIQHGSPSRISIKLDYKPDSLLVQVVDDGTGIHSNISEQPGRGFGLKNMRHRSKCLGAKLEVASKGGRGTRVSLYVPRLGGLARLWRHLRGKSTTRID